MKTIKEFLEPIMVSIGYGDKLRLSGEESAIYGTKERKYKHRNRKTQIENTYSQYLSGLENRNKSLYEKYGVSKCGIKENKEINV